MRHCAGKRGLGKAVYYLIPMTAYALGIILSEIIGSPARKCLKMRWDTILVGVEILIVFILGLIPDSAPYQISQVRLRRSTRPFACGTLLVSA